ncbi:hypothetical protein [Geodermatophilus sp. SYSU D00684]
MLLAPYADPEFEQIGRLVGVPPAVGERALRLLASDQVTARCNGAQPPMSWLVPQADLLGGQLVGGLAPGRAYVRFDGVQLAPGSARVLAHRMAAEWPASAEAGDALTAAVAETWTSWTARQPSWTGTGIDLLSGALPPDTACVGFWWD